MKRIASIQDFSCLGKCSQTVALPVLSAMGLECAALPTALLSAHTAFDGFVSYDLTPQLPPMVRHWQQLGLQFDAIYTGYLGSAEQIAIVADFIRMFKQPGTRVMVDPVMGDYGKLYSSYTQEMCDGMKRLLALADIVTPNLTEACRLLDRPYPAGGRVEAAELEYMAAELAAQGPSQVVITGLSEGEMIENFVYEAGRGTLLKEKKVGGDRSGSGDAFAAIVIASLVRGENLTDAVKKAADFISKCLKYAVELDLPWNYGLPFEEYLTELK